jgi:hypothetical protein
LLASDGVYARLHRIQFAPTALQEAAAPVATAP